VIHYPEPDIDKLDYLRSFQDPIFKSFITRITGDVNSSLLDGKWSEVARHHYSKDQPWNADQSLIIINRHQGKPNPLYLDGTTYQVLFSKPSPGEDRWHPMEPENRVYLNDNEIGSWNVYNSNKTIIAQFQEYRNLKLGPYEGNLSYDGRWIAPLATNSDGNQVAFAFDLIERKKYPDIDLSEINVDWVSISALGQYVVVNGEIEGRKDNTQVFNLNGDQVGSIWYEYGRPSHYDLTVDAYGEEVAVGVSKSGHDEGRVIKRRLRDGQVTVLTVGGYATHTSARNYKRPGWVYVTFQDRSLNWPPYLDEIVAVKLDGSMQVERYAHMHTIRDGYYTEAHAVPSPDGARVMWASNWDDKDGQINTYVLDTRMMDPQNLRIIPGNK
jgi:hypothetical protein